MDARFQMHLMQMQTEEMIKYIENLEHNNAIMLQFIQEKGLGAEFEKLITPPEEAPKDELPQQTSSPRGIMEVHE